MNERQRKNIIECILFVSGDPVSILEIQRSLSTTYDETRSLLEQLSDEYATGERGILLFLTEDTAQLVSNKKYAEYVEELLQPAQTKSFSQAMMETLSIIAYRQPVTRADIEAIRGVRCDYSVGQLMKMELVKEVGRKDCVGRPMLIGTTDKFLRQFGITRIADLPNYIQFSDPSSASETEELDSIVV